MINDELRTAKVEKWWAWFMAGFEKKCWHQIITDQRPRAKTSKTPQNAARPCKNLPEAHTFDAFTLKETTWTGVPKHDKAEVFATERFDLLLSFNPDELPQLEWLATASQAAMKIGLATSHPNDFDIQLETPEGKGVHFFAEQLHLYLDKLVLTKS